MFLPTNITLKFGDSGDFVSELQRRLSAINCFNADAINGFYDGNTVNAVSTFQTQSGIRADGIAGPETLRRLNGVISGDNSSTTSSTNAEEEERKRQEEMLRLQQQQLLAEQQRQLEVQQQEAAMQQWQQQQAAPQPIQPEVSVAQPQPVYVAPQVIAPVAPPAPAIDPIALANQQQLSDTMQQQTQQRVAAPPPRPPEPPQPQAQPVNLQPQQQPQQAVAAAPVPPAPVQVIAPQQAAPAPVAVAAPPPRPVALETPPVTQQPAAQEAAPKGIVGRVAQYANDMVQKIASYIESKLPNHVLNEVKEIGQAMAKSGVKEVAIPDGPEQQRGADTPARGQQQAQQRG